MNYCLLCKEIVEERYNLDVKDAKLNIGIKGYVCRYCFKKFIESYHNKGFFKISRFVAWAKERRDLLRL